MIDRPYLGGGYRREAGVAGVLAVAAAVPLVLIAVLTAGAPAPPESPSLALVRPVGDGAAVPPGQGHAEGVLAAARAPAAGEAAPVESAALPPPAAMPPLPENRAAPPDLGQLAGWALDQDPAAVPATPPATPSPGAAQPGSNAPPAGLNDRAPARLAIVIDDLGHNLAMPRGFMGLGIPLTYSILPEQPYTREVIAMVRDAGYDYLLHLPMEPRDYPRTDPGANALLLTLDSKATEARLRIHLDALEGAIGVNNHMGSAYSFDRARMGIVQKMVAQRGLLYLNSKTSASTVPAKIARERGYRYLERDIFLDHVREEGAIRAALRHAVRRARKTGRAIAIGHPYPETLRVLRNLLSADLERQVTLVSLSDL